MTVLSTIGRKVLLSIGLNSESRDALSVRRSSGLVVLLAKNWESLVEKSAFVFIIVSKGNIQIKEKNEDKRKLYYKGINCDSLC
jgi:hypothetical protein